MATYTVHVVAKDNTASHHAVTTTVSLPALEEGHIRAKTCLVGLTSNNMAYATQGTRFRWWDAFPVLASLLAPYNDQSLYGIVPCWGYAEVLESKVPGIEAGRLVWGFWPSADMPMDFKLEEAKGMPGGGHFVEVSEGRSAMMNMYKRYMLADSRLTASSLDDAKVFERLARAANSRAIWEGGYVINAGIFGPPNPVHPLGAGEWSQETGDLSSAVVVSLSASGRTARSFADNVFTNRKPGTGPLAFVAITSNAQANVFRSPPIPINIVPYGEMTAQKTFDWIASHKPKKVVVVDFGGRENAFDTLFGTLESHFQEKKIEVMAIGVGAEAKAHSASDVEKLFQRNELPNRTMMNTTGIRDTMMERVGEGEYFAGLEKAWQGFLDRGCVDDLELQVGEGVAGERGFERAWEDLCKGMLPVDGAVVFKM